MPPLAKLAAKPLSCLSARRKAGSREFAMEPMANILADTKLRLAEAKATLEAINAGAKLSPGMSREDAVRILAENITFYETTLLRYGWRGNAPRL
jgi:hypothetical protein